MTRIVDPPNSSLEAAILDQSIADKAKSERPSEVSHLCVDPLHAARELDDLADWLRSHINDADVPAGAIFAALWLKSLIGLPETKHKIPTRHIPAVVWAVDDWAEVLASHRESFGTFYV